MDLNGSWVPFKGPSVLALDKSLDQCSPSQGSCSLAPGELVVKEVGWISAEDQSGRDSLTERAVALTRPYSAALPFPCLFPLRWKKSPFGFIVGGVGFLWRASAPITVSHPLHLPHHYLIIIIIIKSNIYLFSHENILFSVSSILVNT